MTPNENFNCLQISNNPIPRHWRTCFMYLSLKQHVFKGPKSKLNNVIEWNWVCRQVDRSILFCWCGLRLEPREGKIKVLIDLPSYPPSFHTLSTFTYLHKNVNMAKIDGDMLKYQISNKQISNIKYQTNKCKRRNNTKYRKQANTPYFKYTSA